MECKRVLRGVRRDAAPDITGRKRRELEELARRWHLARDFYARRLSTPTDAADVISRSRALRERQRDEGWAPYPLAVHYHQTAFLSAAAQVKTAWLATFGHVRWRAGRRTDLSEAQKHWIRVVTKRPLLAQQCLEGRTVVLQDAWALGLDQERESRRLQRTLVRGRPRPRRTPKRNWFIADGRLYRPFLRPEDRYFRGAWVALAGLERGRRVLVPLTGRTLHDLGPKEGVRERSDVRVELGERIVLRTVQSVTVVPRPRDVAAGIDKGHDALVTLSFGDPDRAVAYGAGAGDLVSDWTIRAEETLRQRRRLLAYERTQRSVSPRKVRRIRRNNGGDRRRSRASDAVSRRIRDTINGALNELFRSNPHMGLLHAERLDFVGARRGHAFNRRLRRWLKGFLQQRLAFKAELNGVELHVVNAAYTSQTCPRCWFTSSTNRRAARFQCGSCGYTGSADAVAATNVLRRGSDSAIARFMPSGAVKQILDERWRAALTGGAWGLKRGSARL